MTVMREDLKMRLRKTGATRFRVRLKVAIGVGAVAVASIAAAPLAAAAVPHGAAVASHSARVGSPSVLAPVAVVEHPSGNQDAGSRRQVTGGDVASLGHPKGALVASRSPAARWPHWGTPKGALVASRSPAAMWPALRAPRCPRREQVTSSPLAALGSTKGVAKCRQRRNS